MIDFLAPVGALVHHETGTRPARMGDPRRAESVKNVENKNVATFFFLGRDRGVIGRFFAAIGGVKFFLFLRGPLLRRQIRRRSSFSCFYRGMKRNRSGSSSPTNKLPQNHSEPPLKGEGYPLYLIRGEY